MFSDVCFAFLVVSLRVLRWFLGGLVVIVEWVHKPCGGFIAFEVS